MDTVRIGISVTGTDDNGETRSWSGSGQIGASGMVRGDINATATPVKVNDTDNAGDAIPMWGYFKNNGSVDVAVIWVNQNSPTAYSAALPAGTSCFINLGVGTNFATGDVQIATIVGTAYVNYVLFY